MGGIEEKIPRKIGLIRYVKFKLVSMNEIKTSLCNPV